ncbi:MULTISPECIES: hypothetical protein [Blautia]|jgi:hypothetical protein|uniref:Uncharacterized protein n=1 Tax=Blautia hansenii TaxID=1322 RepID=A0ABX2I646_BLAHA|nr:MULTISPECIES: hypothetical protein [Blautia]MBS5323329.1 hypothetical protein [Lachnospiraceae bacterium]MCB5601051.1 hypothetical protein [Blautia hansenii]MEE0643199.1 hypothetical protein [Blautia sp.]NSJ85770.1 hypothetical protein [Blautia hansenii]
MKKIVPHYWNRLQKEEAYEKFEEIKQVLQKDYEENKEPSGEFNKNICRYVWAVLTECCTF